MSEKKQVAYLGLGVMGAPMARWLASAGHHVRVWNRTRSKAEAWLKSLSNGFDIQLAESPKEAVSDAEVVLCCIGNDDDLRSLCLGEKGVFSYMSEGALFIDHTTASATMARELHAEGLRKGISVLDAPVSGGQAGAENGVLTIMCGGTQQDYERAVPFMEAYAKSVKLMGEPGAGQLTKMVNQICIGGLLQGLSEGINFAEQAGLDVAQVIEVISKGAAQSWQMENRYQTMIEGDFNHGFAVDWMRKDFSIVMNEASKLGVSVPVTALVDQFYADVQNMGGGRWDTSSLLERLRKLHSN